MRRRILLPLLLATSFLTSCSQKFTASQREKLTTLTLSPVVEVENAYTDPQGAADGTMSAVTTATGGGLIGALIGATTEAVQNSSFKGKEGAKFGRLRQLSPQSVSSNVGVEVQKALRANPFTASRLRLKSDNKVVTEVQRFTLTRVGKRPDGQLLMAPQIVAKVEIVDGADKKIGTWPLVAGVSSDARTVSEWVADRKGLQKAYKEAAVAVGRNFATNLAAKTAE